MIQRILILNLLFLSIGQLSFAQKADPIRTRHGLIKVEGAIHSRQVVLETAAGISPITQFNYWEEVLALRLSQDERFLLIYHKTNNESGRNFTTINLESRQTIATAKPGYGGRFEWTRNNNIIHIWGCGSPCSCFQLLDKDLNNITEYCETGFQAFIENDMLIALPLMSVQNGVFNIWSLKNGRLLDTVNFADQHGEYVCWDIESTENGLLVDLRKIDKPDSVIIERLPFLKNRQ